MTVDGPGFYKCESWYPPTSTRAKIMNPATTRATPRDLSKAEANLSTSQRLFQAAADADALIVGTLPPSWRVFAGPKVTAHDTGLLVEIGTWFVAAAIRSKCADVLKKLMVISAAQDDNTTLLEALGVERLATGQAYVPLQLANAEEQIRVTLRAMMEATLNNMLLEIAGGGTK